MKHRTLIQLAAAILFAAPLTGTIQAQVGRSQGLLDANLERLVGVLKQAEHQLWAEPASLVVDRMGFKQSQASEQAPELTLTVLRNANREALVARVLAIGRDMLPKRRDLLSEAERYLR